MSRKLALFVPGDIRTLTGGYGYDREIAAGLRALGWQVHIESLSDSFPEPSAAALEEAMHRLADAAGIVVVDGLALPGLAPLLRAQRERLRIVGLVHHPVALEPDLSAPAARRMRKAEMESFAELAHIVCTSGWTARALTDFGVAAERIDVVEPGTHAAALSNGSSSQEPNLLCVATLTPRKGHAVLLRALQRLREHRWHLHCVGSLDRDAAYASQIRQDIADLGLGARVTLHGELAHEALSRRYEEADLFVLASRLEGYGMVLSEAIAHGLPIVATTGGAVPHTVPAGAASLVPPDDETALAGAIETWLCDAGTRERQRAAAVVARSKRRDWRQAAAEFANVLSALE